ncbi:MAG: tyrosine-type recombinase/integrase [Chloroflexota bacterium]|nr:tyrosine-type recombinase/integrase [Chloroflexota bacterium]
MARRGHNEGSISKRADGRWMARLSLPNGKRKYIYAATRQEVSRQMAIAQRDKEQGLVTTGPGQTVAQYLKDWLENTAKHSVRVRTYECYELQTRRLIPHIGKLRLSALTPAHVQATYNALLVSGLSRRSVELTHAILHRALRQAVQWSLVGRNVTEAVSVPRPGRREMKTLTAEQVQDLFSTTAGDRLHALYVLLATTGLRLGEALGLKWEDIDFNTGRLTIQRALQRQHGVGFVLVEPKTERSRRTVHLAGGTVIALRGHRKRQLEERLVAGPLWEDMALAFTTPTGGPIEAWRVNELFHKALERAGLPRIRVHDLRHTAATLLAGPGDPSQGGTRASRAQHHHPHPGHLQPRHTGPS